MKSFGKFIAVGSLFATVEEFLTIVVLKHDVGSYVFTLVILFPVFLTIVFFSSKALDTLSRTLAAREFIHYVVYGMVGLLFEWFVIGLSPWSNPDANPLLMCGFQLGMFSFWTTVSFAPRLFTSSHARARTFSRSILRFFVPYFGVAYLIGLAVPANLKFVTIIPLVVIGYLIVNLYFVTYLMRSFSERNPVAETAA